MAKRSLRGMIKPLWVRAVIFVLVLFVLLSGAILWSWLTLGMASVQTSKVIPNLGSLKTVGVGVYWDANFKNRVSSIDWGVFEPGLSKNVTVNIRNEGNSVASLTMYTSNWNPSNASNYMRLTWNYRGQSINVGEAVQVTVSLSVNANIAGTTSFSFDIVIVASG